MSERTGGRGGFGGKEGEGGYWTIADEVNDAANEAARRRESDRHFEEPV
ncbi:MAG: hypothetical protein HS117_10950 [Verrucomicrobiaceae bacterium]|nr:hypothetical protein [Verrucomicrobiaceae bacterium]